jgi:hypothetical protein
MRRRLVGLVLCLLASDATAAPTCRTGSQRMSRVELYFGAGAHAGRGAWQDFLARVVTPRFPQGLTELEGRGQWRGPRGLQRETSRVIVIVYRPDPTSDGKIEAIRSRYKARFRQTSVLRVDTTACVSF